MRVELVPDVSVTLTEAGLDWELTCDLVVTC